MPAEGADGSTNFQTPEQSVGARGVNNIAAKKLMALFPPNTPFFKMEVDDLTATEMTAQKGAKDEVDRAFAQFIRRVMTDVEGRALRSDLYEVFRLNVVTGNSLLYVTEEGRCRVYRLDKYVVDRDPSGTVLEIVIKEPIAQAALPEDVRKAIPQTAVETPPATGGLQQQPASKPFDLYTHVVLDEEGQYQVYQEIEGVVVPGSEGSFLPEDLPFIPARYNKVDGEAYGRGHVEEYLGDLGHLESLSKSVREFVAIASRVTPIIDPNSGISVKEFVDAENGRPLSGDIDGIKFLQIERYNDFRVAEQMISKLEQRLAFAFLLNTAIQRPGERVTAEEIRYMARELEDTLGGTYSVQAVELQLPLARLLIKALERRGALPELPQGMVSPKIVTGMDALGRGNDLSNLIQFLELTAESPAGQAIKWDGVALRIANSLNVETEGLLMSPEEFAQAQQQAQMAAMIQQLGPNAVNQLGGMAQKQMETQTAQ